MNIEAPKSTPNAPASPAAATRWEYLFVSLSAFQPAKSTQGQSAAVDMLNREGQNGWEAVGMTALQDGSFAVLLKRPIA